VSSRRPPCSSSSAHRPRLKERLAGGLNRGQSGLVSAEPVIYREETLAVIGAMADILVELRKIRTVLEGDDDEEVE
jgi:hypothetical protein